MTDAVDMALDDIIRRNRVSRSRGRGGPARGGGRRGGGRGAGRGRGRPLSRPGTPVETRSQFTGRGRGKRSQSRARSQSRTRSRSRQRRSTSRASRSRSRLRALTPKGRVGLENQQPQRSIVSRGNRGGQYRLRRGNSLNRVGWQQKSQSIHSRLGVVTRRGAANQPLAVPKRGISKRGRGLTVGNRYSGVGLRSDQILKQQRQNLLYQNNIIRSQTFRRSRSRNNSFNDISQLTVSVENEFVKKRRNSMGSNNYLNKRSLAQLNNQFGGYTPKRGPGSAKSMGSYRSNRSKRSNNSNTSARSGRSRGRGRGRGVARKFVSGQYLDTKLQKEIAILQRKNKKDTPVHDTSIDTDFSPTPASTSQTLHQRFGI